LKSKQKRHLTTFTRVVILTAFYFAGGLLGKEASFLSGSIALVWPLSGIALAAILLFGYRFWPGVALGAILFSFMNGVPLGFFTLGTAIGNTMGAVICTFLLRRFIAFDNAMERTSDVVGYIGLACFLGTTVNAAFNVVGLVYAGAASWEGFTRAASSTGRRAKSNFLSVTLDSKQPSPGKLGEPTGSRDQQI
jgi:integral membrane sensor domain MASE1